MIKMHVKKDFMMYQEDPKNRFKSLMKQSNDMTVVVDCPNCSAVELALYIKLGKFRLNEITVEMV